MVFIQMIDITKKSKNKQSNQASGRRQDKTFCCLQILNSIKSHKFHITYLFQNIINAHHSSNII